MRANDFEPCFGLQRFGSSTVLTHHVGVAILRGDFDEAVNLILCPRDEAKHKSYLNAMRATWKETKDAGKALDALPRKHAPEGKLLFGLKDNPKDFVCALGRLPRTLRQMYVHAVQIMVRYQIAKLANFKSNLKKVRKIRIGCFI